MGVNNRVKFVFRLPLLARRMMDRSGTPTAKATATIKPTDATTAKGQQLSITTVTTTSTPTSTPTRTSTSTNTTVTEDPFPGQLYINSSPVGLDTCYPLSPCTSPPPLSPCAKDDDDDDDDFDDHCFQLNAPHMAVSRSCAKEVLALDFAQLDDTDSGGSSSSSPNPSQSRLVRIVSWASIKDRCRWRTEQERELMFAEHELARCQKAWSSEQELWLAYIKALNEEKEAHEDFLHHRAKQQGDEQHHFRKVWNRRRSSQDKTPTPTSPRLTTGGSKLGLFRVR